MRLPFIDTPFATRGYSYPGAHGHERQLNARGHIDLQVPATLTGTLVHIIAEQPGHMLAAACQSIHNCAQLGQVGKIPPRSDRDVSSNLPAGNENGCLRDIWLSGQLIGSETVLRPITCLMPLSAAGPAHRLDPILPCP
jgi:hypothetical protein